MFVNTKQRSNQAETMDDLALEGDLLRDTLYQLARINYWLGGYRPTIGAIKKMIQKQPENQLITIVDVGCGGGDMLREIAGFGRKYHRNFKLIGIDANSFIINYAREKTVKYPEIEYISQNIFSDEFAKLEYDIAMFNLVLHHFSDDEIIRLLKLIVAQAKMGVIVNDLHRSALAYFLFQIVCLGISNPMARDDGLISILKGFKKEELIDFSEKLKLQKYVVQWKWAFRYLWTIEN